MLRLVHQLVEAFSHTKTVKVKSVRITDDYEDVYNITVDNVHNYSVDNGMVIKNCDALRYACEELPRFGLRV